MGRGVLDHCDRLLASGEALQRVHRHGSEARRHLPEAPLVPAESPDEHDMVVDDQPAELRRAIVPGFLELAGLDHGADRPRQALCRNTLQHPFTFTNDTVGRIGRTWMSPGPKDRCAGRVVPPFDR
jgi:hypothetical protein